MENCVFCKIVAGSMESTKIYENDQVLAFLDIKPINPGHILVIPKKHAELITELDKETLAELFVVVQKVVGALKNSGLRADGISYILADGAQAGQEVMHAHLHVIPRFQNDGFGFQYPQNYGTPADRDDLNKIGDQIKKGFV